MIGVRYLNTYVILCIIWLSYSQLKAQTIWRKVYAYQYELFFTKETASSYKKAENFCNGISAKIVQLEDEYVRKAVYFTIGNTKNVYFWIGAKRSRANKNEWNWISGPRVNKSSIEWYSTDNYGSYENNMVIRNSDNKVGTVSSNYNNAATICQKDIGLSFPWKIDTSKYHVTIFNDSMAWERSYSKCSDIEATLFELEDANVKKLVYKLISRIGATKRCDTCDEWVWSDGSVVNMSLISRNNGQPGNVGGNTDKLSITRHNKKFTSKENNKKGIICQSKKVFCDLTPNVCDNGRICITTSGLSSCECPAGFYGVTCSNKGLYCEAQPDTCKNGGVCLSTTKNPFYSCICAFNGYFGTSCTDNYCDTYANPCKNGGTCSHITESPFFKCTCANNGYYGKTCESMVTKLKFMLNSA